MKLVKVKIRNFRAFGEEEIISVSDLTTLIGSNSSGKTTFFNALLKLFGESGRDREITRADFHVPSDVNPDTILENDLSIEVIFEFPEVIKENGTEKFTVPIFFQNFVVDATDNKPPYIRIRLESSWKRSNQPEGLIETSCFFIVAPEDTIVTNQHKKGITQSQLSQIKMIYVPALRDPSTQLRMVAGTLLWRLIQRINFDNSFKELISVKMHGVKEILNQHSGIAQVKDIIKDQWKTYHKDVRYSEVDLHFNTQDIESILKKIDPFFSPTEVENGYTVDTLGDGLRSLFYFSLVGSLLKTEEITLREMLEDPEKSIDDRLFSIIPPCLTIVAVEEPENHVAPHLLGKIIHNLQSISDQNNAQVILSSHSPAIVKRVDPTEIKHFRMCKIKKSTITRSVLLPKDDEAAYKYVKEAVKAYPEIYFSSLVLLGEGDSEEIIIPRILDLIDVNINVNEISVVPLGGRHVNHFWRLLYQLDIPFITLLDLDLERGGGGWGRIKYILDQLILNGVKKNELLELSDGTILSDDRLKEMHNWDPGMSYELQGWINYLERYNVFFSTPLDIDFLMLESYFEGYTSQLESSEGPKLKVGKTNKKILELNESDKKSDEYKARLELDIACTLKDEEKEGKYYSDHQKEMMIWYKYLFLYRGKPSTHMKMLSQTEDDVLRVALPSVFNRIADSIKTKLQIREDTV
ncbi:ATP-dependent nuclease [Brevibacillus sp. NRS-1366]|uniref:ATP-dependent nuclease n=1 Tax=Brevibacillus sp. NRS-1366 TaxID=3233899 RepID=UPI003D25B898